MPLHPFTTQIVGSYVKPRWLTNPQRTGAFDGSWWRPEADVLDEARDDAARLAIYDQERAGLALVTDGEVRRGAYDRHYLSGLDGLDWDRIERLDHRAEYVSRMRVDDGNEEYVDLSRYGPRVVGPLVWRRTVGADELRFARAHATRPVKITVGGPLTLARRVNDSHYGDEDALVMTFAQALNGELRALEAAGADVLQLDEPRFHSGYSVAERIGREALTVAVDGITIPVIVHVCYGYAIVFKDKSPSEIYPGTLEVLADSPISAISLEYEQPGHEPDLLRHCGDKHVVLGLLDLSKPDAETAEHVARRIDAALKVVPAERLHPASDCGMWYLQRPLAFAKLEALAGGTRLVAGAANGPEAEGEALAQ